MKYGMREMNRHLPIALLLFSVVMAGTSCGGSESPTNPTPPPPPPPSTFTLSGGVTESEPTTSTKIPGATVAFVDGGANAGKTATADAAGNYQITNVVPGAFTVRASAPGYQDATRPVTVSANTSLTIALNPTPRTVTIEPEGTVSGGDTPCSDGTSDKGCKILTLEIHNPGTLEATLEWENPTTDLDLTLWRGTTLLADSRDEFSLKEVVSSSIVTGATYELHVTYYAGSVITPYKLIVTHPN